MKTNNDSKGFTNALRMAQIVNVCFILYGPAIMKYENN